MRRLSSRWYTKSSSGQAWVRESNIETSAIYIAETLALHLEIHLTVSTGVATRLLQLGIEMRPFFQRGGLWVYPMFAGIGGSFGYWLKGVEDRQMKMLVQRKQIVVEKRRRRAEREERDTNASEVSNVEGAGVLASTS